MIPEEDPVLYMNELIAGLKKSDLILDVGSSSGSFDYSTNEGQIIAIDVHFPKTEKFESMKEQENVHFIKADARFLPFKDGSFDLVINNWTLEHFPNVALCINEADRITRAGGLFYASIPDGYSFDDRLYGFLTRHKDHINFFSFESFIKEIYERTRFKLVRFMEWRVGFTYLNFEDGKGLTLNRFFKTVMQKAYVRRLIVRLLRYFDPRFRSHMSRCGWLFLFRKNKMPGIRRSL
ncbi:MAG: class I SAM-dependent methyltransferase, partial [Candidatus Undinarchaeales archaeon]|nr:class I SAM-dependent methyltransferase [Candidatus Undinarchaeales archaeon]